VITTVELAPGYRIPRVILGGWQLSAGHSAGSAGRDQVFETWDRAETLGLNTLDCADIYTGVEALIGEYVRRRRAAGQALPQVHTKFVPDLAALPTIDRRYVRRVVERSLDRLGLERLDLVQFHWWEYAVPGYREALGWLGDLTREGKIRLVGLTNFDEPRTRELLEMGIPIATTQVQYSVLDQRPARGLARLASENEIGLLCYGTIAGGFLSDRWLGAPEPADWENRSLVKYRLIIEEVGGWGRYQTILAALATVAARHDVSIAPVAIGWVLDRPSVAAAIVGTRGGGHLDSIEAALRLRLTEADRAEIAQATGPNPGPAGGVYEVERMPGGKHAEIMRYDLNARAGD
jgi:aryl-alcohol dehydrogenase-like predicted oxidoreductase